MNLNIDQEVEVRLTKVGRAVHKQHWRDLGMPIPEFKEDANGWSRWSLGELMHIFGRYCRAPEPPFEATIRTIEKNQ